MDLIRPRRLIQIPAHEHFTPDRPDIGKYEHPEKDAYNQQLTAPAPRHDHRPIAVKPRLPVLEPQFNQLYGTGRSPGDWRYFIDNFAVGTMTTVANTSVTTAIALNNQPNWRLSQWPAAIQLYLVIRGINMAPQSAITTVGSIDVQFQDTVGGNTIPLGDFVSNSSLSRDFAFIIPTPITDPGNVNVGNLLVKLAGTTPTVSVYNYQMLFSGCYLLPTLEGYEVESIHHVLKKDASNE